MNPEDYQTMLCMVDIPVVVGSSLEFTKEAVLTILNKFHKCGHWGIFWLYEHPQVTKLTLFAKTYRQLVMYEGPLRLLLPICANAIEFEKIANHNHNQTSFDFVLQHLRNAKLVTTNIQMLPVSDISKGLFRFRCFCATRKNITYAALCSVRGTEYPLLITLNGIGDVGPLLCNFADENTYREWMQNHSQKLMITDLYRERLTRVEWSGAE
jgi:hypothetical protein